jgi:CRISPR-associated protein Csh2
MTQSNSTPVENRQEIAFLYDVLRNNPNGDPRSGANRPRLDPETNHCYVTDVRLKRYIRDQLEDDGFGILIRNAQNEDGEVYTREQLLQDRLDEVDLDDVAEENLRDEIFGNFLDNSADVRYFGATLGVDTDDDRINNALPDQFTGPVQFSPGRSLHPVTINEEYNSLTSVIATKEGKQSGGYDLDDHRINYGLIGFHGLVDENGADTTNLTQEDVERLDTLLWRSLKNQTITRSKVGQEPRFYLRVEYETNGFHIGGLTEALSLDEDRSKQAEEIRNVTDVTVDLTDLKKKLEANGNRVANIYLVVDQALSMSYHDAEGDETYTSDEYPVVNDFLKDMFSTVVDPATSLTIIDPYEKAQQMASDD